MTAAASGFDISPDGRVREVQVLQIAEGLHERFPDADRLAIEVNLMVARAYGVLSSLVAEHWAELGLTPHRFTTLRMLFLAKEHRLSMTEVGGGLNVGPANVTKLIDAMERDGLVSRVRDSSDRRVIHAELTEVGRNRYLAARPETHRRLKEAWDLLSKEEKEMLVHLLAKLRMLIVASGMPPGSTPAPASDPGVSMRQSC